MGRHALVTGAALLVAGAAAKPSKPSIVWFLTDDQDQMLGASFPTKGDATPLPKTRSLMADMGSTAENFFIHTPICCPSRSELLSGRYFHNIKKSCDEDGCGCMHVDEEVVNGATFARKLKEEAGYTVGMFGKYLNNMPSPTTGGPGAVTIAGTTVPAGFDAWLGNGGGDYISPSFNAQNITFGDFGIANGMWHGTEDNYTTSVVGNVSIAWIRHVVAENPDRPFFAYVAPKAAHEPFNPAPWYADAWDPEWPTEEPAANPSWNSTFAARADHHGNIATEDLITPQAAKVITGVFKNRWRTLMSVDDVIADVIGAVEDLGLADNTYFFYSSDHGFQLGEFNIPMDKRQPYEWDTRIHLLARGPGIKAGSTWAQPATQVDMAPTFLGLAGLDKTAVMDGKSLVPLLMPSAYAGDEVEIAKLPESTKKHVAGLLAKAGAAGAKAYAANWRTAAFVEYYYVADNVKCVGNCTLPKEANAYPHADTYCTDLTPGAYANCWAMGCSTECYPTESIMNNFIVLRSMEGSPFGDTMYAEFESGNLNQQPIAFDNIYFHEYYNVTADPWEMNNLYNLTAASTQKALHDALHVFASCTGDACP